MDDARRAAPSITPPFDVSRPPIEGGFDFLA